MAHLTLNCPECRRKLVYVPRDGMTLHYRCDEHGLLIIQPLIEVSYAEQARTSSAATGMSAARHDAA